MKSKYEQQAEAFLNATKTAFKCEFLRHGKHFIDDKDTRDIYKITLTRGKRSYTFNFGQSIADSGFYYTMGKQKVNIDRKYLLQENKQNLIHHIRREANYQFVNNGKSDTIHYPIAPTAYDVLACLTKNDPGTFEDFCSEFGYDEDSRKAEKIYNAVLDEWKNVCALFTDEEIEQLQEIN